MIKTSRDSRLVIVRKTADETVNNSNVLQNDDELKLAVGIGEAWAVDLYLYFNSGATPDIKIDFTGPAGAVFRYTVAYKDTGDSNSITMVGSIGSALAFGGPTGSAVVHVSGIYIGAAAAGTLQLQWAQNTADASNTKMQKNSCIIAHRLN